MKITEFLTEHQLNRILDVIQTQCDNAARDAVNERRNISIDLYNRLNKGRQPHNVTRKINIALLYPENSIIGLTPHVVSNGIYTQIELENENVLIHIYHHSNNLNSRLVQNRMACGKQFFCIKYKIDNNSRLKSIESIHIASNETETLYTAPRVVQRAG